MLLQTPNSKQEITVPFTKYLAVQEITVPLARYFISRTENKTFKRNKDKIKETKIYRYWPMFIITVRDIIRGSGYHVIEADLLFPEENPQFDKIPWQEYAVELLQMFRNNPEWVSEASFKSSFDGKFTIIYRGLTGKEIRYAFPISENYEGMITNLLKRCWLTNSWLTNMEDDQHKKHYKEDERQVALIGLYDACISYAINKRIPLPIHLEFKTRETLSNTFKHRDYSTEKLNKERLQEIRWELQNTDEKDLQTYTDKHFKKRILKEKLESLGGSLDNLIGEDEKDEAFKDTLEDKDTPSPLENIVNLEDDKERELILQEIRKEIQRNPEIAAIVNKREKKTATERQTLKRFKDKLGNRLKKQYPEYFNPSF